MKTVSKHIEFMVNIIKAGYKNMNLKKSAAKINILNALHNRFALIVCMIISLYAVNCMPAEAAYILRYNTIAKGAITFTGNTLGLSQYWGTRSSIGAFITTDTSSSYMSYPYGTTGNWWFNNSAAQLRMPAGSTVLYAELVWGGTYRGYYYQDVSAYINDPVVFTTPAGTYSVAPDAITSRTLSNPTYYVRSADVTSLVQAGGAGTYATGNVAATNDMYDSESGHAGWTLAVVYQNDTLPNRSMSLYTGSEITSRTTTTTSTITDFGTPPTGPLHAKLFVSATEGDSGITGDQMRIGRSVATLAPVSGPNNNINNFFCGQINDDNGLLDTAGTFGTSNATPGSFGSMVRQGWDITAVDVSAQMSHSQNQVVIRGTTSGDQYMINALGFQIKVGSPQFDYYGKTVDKATTYLGDILTYTVKIRNNGTSDAENVIFFDYLPQGVSFIPGSITLNGVSHPEANTADGFPIGNIPIGAESTVTFQARVNGMPLPPAAAEYRNTAFWLYDYREVSNSPIMTAYFVTNPAVTKIARLEVNKATSVAGAVSGNQTVTYTITVKNTGTAPTSGTTLHDVMPDAVNYINNSTTLNGTSVPDLPNNVMPYSTPNEINSPGASPGVIAIDGTATVRFRVRAKQNPPPIITNVAYVDPDGPGPEQPIRVEVSNPSLTSNLTVTKTDNSTTAVPGTPVTYTISVKNNGAMTLNSVRVSEELPPTLKNPVYTPSVGTYNADTGDWTGLTFAPGQTITLTLTAMIRPKARGTLVNTVTVLPPMGVIDTNLADNTASDSSTLIPQADLAIVKTDGVTQVEPGSTLNYSITVTNNGPSTVETLKIIDILPVDLCDPVFTVTRGYYDPETGIWEGLSVPAGESITLMLQARLLPTDETTVSNTATVEVVDDFVDPVPSNNSSTDTNAIVPVPRYNISGYVYEDKDHNFTRSYGDTGTGITGLYVKAIELSTGLVPFVVPVDPDTGYYVIPGVIGGCEFNLIVDNNDDPNEHIVYVQPGWLGTEAAGCLRENVSAVNGDLIEQNFGLWHGTVVRGVVFVDDGSNYSTANNGVNDEGTFIPGSPVSVSGSVSGTVYDSTVTDAVGRYRLWVPHYTDSVVRVKQTNLPGYVSTGADVGNTISSTYYRDIDTMEGTGSLGMVYEGLDFGDVPDNIFINDGEKHAVPGEIVVYPHKFTARTEGTVSFSITNTMTPHVQGWTQYLYLDSNGDGILDADDPLITGPINVSLNQDVNILIKDVVPPNAPFGASNLITVTAEFDYLNANPALARTYTRRDNTIVGSQCGTELKLVKSVDKTTALSGDNVTYTITYTNTCDKSISNVKINDMTPAYTTFISAAFDTLPLNLTACTITKPDVGAAGDIFWDFTGTLAAGSSGTVTFVVKVD